MGQRPREEQGDTAIFWDCARHVRRIKSQARAASSHVGGGKAECTEVTRPRGPLRMGRGTPVTGLLGEHRRSPGNMACVLETPAWGGGRGLSPSGCKPQHSMFARITHKLTDYCVELEEATCSPRRCGSGAQATGGRPQARAPSHGLGLVSPTLHFCDGNPLIAHVSVHCLSSKKG